MCNKRDVLFFVIGVLCLAAAPVLLFCGMGLKESLSGPEQTAKRQWHFKPIMVEDAGNPLWEKTWGMDDGSVVSVIQYDYFADEQCLEQEDGIVRPEDVDTMHLNNIWFSVPGRGTRELVNPVFSTELVAEGQREMMKEWNGRDMTSVQYAKDFQKKIERARVLIREGYLQDYLETYLKQYPEINPDERRWTLEYVDGGWTDREEDGVRWGQLNYRLITSAENGEIIPVGWLEIHQTSFVKDHAVRTDVDYRMHPDGRGMWWLLEDDSADKGRVWVDQMPDQDFSDEQAVKDFVKQQGAGFLLPEGADEAAEWKYRKEQGYWYDYLIWQGTTADYDLTLAVPLMPEGSGGWYAASRIRRQADNKSECAHVLSAVIQTLRTEPYVYMVRKGDTVTDIIRKYAPDCRLNDTIYDIAELNDLRNPDLIYPGQQIMLPAACTGKEWKFRG